MAKKALVLLAEGFEEVETVTPITYLRRACVEVTTAAIGESLTVNGARRGQIKADTTLTELAPNGVPCGMPDVSGWDAVIIPGGIKGAENMAACEKAGIFIKEMAKNGKLVCAICASPAIVLAPLGLLSGKKFTCYPGFEDKVKDGKWLAERIVIDGNIITSRAAGTSGEFAIEIIKHLLGETEAEKIAKTVLL